MNNQKSNTAKPKAKSNLEKVSILLVILSAIFLGSTRDFDRFVGLSNIPPSKNGRQIFEKLFSEGSGAITESKLEKMEIKVDKNGALFNVSGTYVRNAQTNNFSTYRPLGDFPSLGPGMVNVSSDGGGHIFENKGVKVIALFFSEEKLPAGYTINDIHTYRFDNFKKQWIQLKRDSIDISSSIIFSQTSAGGDFINAIIKVPEAPETQGYIPTTMSEIKVGDPGSMVQLFETPKANHQGTATLNYKIETSHGRQAIEPQLSLNYNSDANNVGLGEGWSLDGISGISVESRWGVPPFSVDDETETYLFDGQMLIFQHENQEKAAHRFPGIKRNEITKSDTTTFYVRKMENFDKILRIGNHPSNYRWVTVDKKGTKYFYGGTTSLNVNSVLAHPMTGNVAEWKLMMVEDVQGNIMDVYHSRSSASTPGSEELVSSICLDSISYSRFRNPSDDNDRTPAKYKLIISHKKKFDITNLNISGRYGFLSANLDSIIAISSYFLDNREATRSYKFFYKKDLLFGKILLDSIAQYGKNAAFFYGQKFDYHTLGGNNKLFSTPKAWHIPHDGLRGPNSFPLVPNSSTALGASSSSNKGFSMYFGLGLIGNPGSKDMTAGMQFSSSSSNSIGLNALFDISGDGLPDKVFIKDNRLRYHKNNGLDGFDEGSVDIIGADIRSFSSESTRSSSSGAQGLFAGFSIGMENSNTESIISTYLADVNGDGLTDIVSDNIVYFNCGYRGGASHLFSRLSSSTRVPIIHANTIQGFDFKVSNNKRSTIENENPLHEIVRIWEAPFDGDISIIAPVKKIRPTKIQLESKDYNNADGVKVSIQLGDLAVLDSVTIVRDNYDSFLTKEVKTKVNKGDYIYFRLQSGTKSDANGSFDNVIWQPQIKYSQFRPFGLQQDIYERNIYSYDIAKDYLFSSPNGFALDQDIRKFDLKGTFQKSETIDTVHISINQFKRNEVKNERGELVNVTYDFEKEIFTKSYLPRQIVENEVLEKKDLDVISDNRIFKIEIKSSANSDMAAINWKPVINFQKSFSKKCLLANGVVVECSPIQTIVENKKLYVVPHYDFSDSLSSLGEYWHVPDTGAYHFLPVVQFLDTLKTSGKILFTLRDSVSILSRVEVPYQSGHTISDTIKTLRQFHKAQHIFTSFESKDSSINNKIKSVSVELNQAPINAQIALGATQIQTTGKQPIRRQGRYSFRPEMKVEGYKGNGSLYLKYLTTGGKVLDSTLIVLISDKVNIPEVPQIIRLSSGDTIVGRIHTLDTLLAQSIKLARFSCNENISPFFWTKRKEEKFGPMFRGWGQFIYNGMGGRAAALIKKDSLKVDRSSTIAIRTDVEKVINGLRNADTTTVLNINGIDNLGPMKARFSILGAYADSTRRRYQGGDQDIYLTGDTSGSSRLGLDDVKIKNPFELAIQNSSGVDKSHAYGVNKVIYSSNSSKYAGYDPLTVNGSKSKDNSKVVSDFLDLNGDRFPDIIGPDKIQFSNTLGGLKPVVDHSLGLHESKNSSEGLGLGGGFHHSAGSFTLANGSNSPAKKGDVGAANSKAVSVNAKANVGANGSGSLGQEEIVETWMDINGDGLSDKVSKNLVRLNLGLNDANQPVFTKHINLSTGEISKGRNMSISPGISLGFNFASQSFSGGVGLSVSNSVQEYFLQDFNADGIPDKVTIDEKGLLEVEFNTGLGFLKNQISEDITVSPTVLVSGNAATLSTSYLPNIPSFGGLPNPINDWVKFDQKKFSASVGQSLGASFTFGFNIWIPFTPFIRFVFNPAINKSNGLSKSIRQMIDIDGDGFLDYTYSTNENELLVRLSMLGKINKLKEVKNPLGGTITIDYKHNEATSDHPGGKWVMADVEMNDGIVSDRSSVASTFDSKQNFEYSSGKYDRYEREFLGFGKVTTVDNDFNGVAYRKHVSEYDTANIYVSGNLLREYKEDNKSRIFTETVNEYYSNAISPTGQDYRKVAPISKEQIRKSYFGGICFTGLKRRTNFSYEGKSTKIVLNQSLYEYNRTGAVQSFKYAQGREISGSNYDYSVDINYWPTDFKRHILDLPNNVKVVKDGQVFRESSTNYNNFGKPELIEKRIDEKLSELTTLTYDQYGNISTLTRPNGLLFKYDYDRVVYTYVEKVTQMPGFSSESTYDLEFGTLIRSKDKNENFVRYELDNFGRIAKVIGPNECNEDQLTNCDDPYTILINYSLGKPSYSKVTHFDRKNPGIQTINFVDGFDRSIGVKKTAVVSNADGSDNSLAKWIVSERNMYDPFGRIVKKYFPDLDQSEVGSKNIPKINPQSAFTEFEYDVLDRVTGKKLPDGAYEFKTTYFTRGNLSADSTTRYNLGINGVGNDQYKLSYTNGAGLTAREVSILKTSSKNEGDLSIVTDYHYDGIYQLKTVIDDNGNETKYDYDLAGNRKQIIHPDGGATVLLYDKASRLVAKISANGAIEKDTIRYTYDRYNHLTNISYTRHQENNVKYSYGADGIGCNKCRDRLIFQEDASGAQTFEYGRLGEITKATRTLIAPFNKQLFTFVMEYDYDTWNRLQSIKYPDGEIVKYTYNIAGLLTNISGKKTRNNAVIEQTTYVSQIGYDEFEQRVSLKYGNGTSTFYSYNPKRRRLDNLKVSGMKVGPNSLFSSFTSIYNYDNQNNITENTISQSGPSLSMKHSFAYDQLNRLDSATGSWVNGQQKATYGLGVNYDNLYNINRKYLKLTSATGSANQQIITYSNTFEYDSLRPHQVSKLREVINRNNEQQYTESNTEVYTYDHNGNNTLKATGDKSGQQGVTERKILWDEENRMLAVSMAGYVSNYVYDGSGERTIKLSSEVEGVFINGQFAGDLKNVPVTFNLYASPYYSIRNGLGLYTKHIYIGNQRIISQLENEASFRFDGAKNPIHLTSIGLCPSNSIDCKDTVGYVLKRQQLNHRINQDFEMLQVPYHALEDWDFKTLPVHIYEDIQNPFEKKGNGVEKLPKLGEVAESFRYFYHSNQIGSTSFITDNIANVVQYVEYLPFGETFIEQRRNYSSQFMFSGKQQDSETGLYYFGARYYDPHFYQWLGVDPLLEQNPSISPYNYVLGNPIKMNDPDGKLPQDVVNLAYGTLNAIAYDVAIPEVSDVFVPKWAAYAVLAGVASAIVYNEAIKDPTPASEDKEVKSRSSGSSQGDRAGKDFTKKGKEQVWEQNKQEKAGKNECENCNIELERPSQSKSGVTTPKNAGQVDHTYPKSKGGNGSPDNGQLLCPGCNVKKADKLPVVRDKFKID